MRKELHQLKKSEFESVKASGLLWELFPNAPSNYEDIKMKHTPGPWKYEDSNHGGYDILTADGSSEYICQVNGAPYENAIEQQPNAALIATAPELLHALKMARAWLINQKVNMDLMPKGLDSFEQLEQVIAREEGH